MNSMNVQIEKGLPEGMTIERNPGEDAIDIYDVPLRIFRLMFLWGTPLIVLVIAPGIFALLIIKFGHLPLDKFIQRLPVVIGVYLIPIPLTLYITLVRGKNRTKIIKRSGSIEVHYGPFPVPGHTRARSFHVNEIAQIDHADERGRKGVLRRISFVLRDSKKFSVGRWSIPVADAVMHQLRSMIG